MDFAPWLIVIVPLVLWALFSLLTREWKRKRLFGLIAGADNRLSLSRLQAFAWTMVIFGTYSAAMWVHPIRVGAEEKKAAQAKVERAVAEEKALEDKWKTAPSDSKIKGQLDTARQNTAAAKTELASYAWVRIPSALLTLAGISLATGIFASALGSGGRGRRSSPTSSSRRRQLRIRRRAFQARQRRGASTGSSSAAADLEATAR